VEEARSRVNRRIFLYLLCRCGISLRSPDAPVRTSPPSCAARPPSSPRRPSLACNAASPTTPSRPSLHPMILREQVHLIIAMRRSSLQHASAAHNSRDELPLRRIGLQVYAQYRSHHDPSQDSSSARHNADLKPYPTAPTLPHCPIPYYRAAGMSRSCVSRNAPMHLLYHYHRIPRASDRLSVSPPPATAPLLAGPDHSAYSVPLYSYSSYPHFLSSRARSHLTCCMRKAGQLAVRPQRAEPLAQIEHEQIGRLPCR
jgi:hypothetical protein